MHRIALLGLLALATPAAASAQTPAGPAPAATQVIVRYLPGVDAQERGQVRSAADVSRAEVLPLERTDLVDPDVGVGVAAAVRRLERQPGVLYAEPDAPRRALAVPNDRFFARQWGLSNTAQVVTGEAGEVRGTAGADLDALAAWDITTGSSAIPVAVIDSGVNLTHPDLVDNVWKNPGETGPTAKAGVDDDANGLVDDVNGWDWSAGDAQPLDEEGHGSHVAGTIGAKGNNGVGVAGVAWTSALMALRVLDADGGGSVSDAIRAYDYARRKGARVANLSFGGPDYDRAERDALAAAPNVLFVAAAGNDAEDVDQVGSYPCEDELPNVVCVAASDRSDALAEFSDFGRTTVDLAAPGVDIASTYKDPGYVFESGTSMAAPHVAGVAALALAAAPGLTVAQLRAALLATTDAVPGLACTTVTGGRVSALGAVQAAKAMAAGGATPAVTPRCGAATPDPTPTTTTTTTTTPPPTTTAPPTTTPPPATPPPPATTPTITAPPTTPTPVASVAPTLDVRAPASVSSPRLRAFGLGVTPRCSGPCVLTATLTLDARSAKRRHLPTRRVASLRTGILAAGEHQLTLRLSQKARARFRGGATAVLSVTATDTAGRRVTRTRRVTIKP